MFFIMWSILVYWVGYWDQFVWGENVYIIEVGVYIVSIFKKTFLLSLLLNYDLCELIRWKDWF